MDKTQLNELRNKYDALLRLGELVETGHHCTVNKGRHSLSTVNFRLSDNRGLIEIRFIHDKDGSFEVRIDAGPLALSKKSKNALEAMSSTMATVIKSVLNEELVEMKKIFGEISINGEKCQPIT